MKVWDYELNRMAILKELSSQLCDYNYAENTKIHKELYKELDEHLWVGVFGVLRNRI